jgi:uncharacterized coiled-coil protein SlyX
MNDAVKEAVKDCSQVRQWLNNLYSNLCELENNIDKLSEIVHSVTKPDGTTLDSTLKEVEPPALVPLADELRSMSKHVERLTAHLRSLNSRIEL